MTGQDNESFNEATDGTYPHGSGSATTLHSQSACPDTNVDDGIVENVTNDLDIGNGDSFVSRETVSVAYDYQPTVGEKLPENLSTYVINDTGRNFGKGNKADILFLRFGTMYFCVEEKSDDNLQEVLETLKAVFVPVAPKSLFKCRNPNCDCQFSNLQQLHFHEKFYLSFGKCSSTRVQGLVSKPGACIHFVSKKLYSFLKHVKLEGKTRPMDVLDPFREPVNIDSKNARTPKIKNAHRAEYMRMSNANRENGSFKWFLQKQMGSYKKLLTDEGSDTTLDTLTTYPFFSTMPFVKDPWRWTLTGNEDLISHDELQSYKDWFLSLSSS